MAVAPERIVGHDQERRARVEQDPSKSEYYRVHKDVPEEELKIHPPSPMPDGLEGLTSDDLHPLASRERAQ
jgi:hypothetical protein